MADPSFIAALHRRYDGPLPAHAAAPHDWDRSWRQQIIERKRLAWREVRRLARSMVIARRTAGRRGRQCRRARGSLAHALQTWVLYRNWLRALERGT